jgi:hypothetical protein
MKSEEPDMRVDFRRIDDDDNACPLLGRVCDVTSADFERMRQECVVCIPYRSAEQIEVRLDLASPAERAAMIAAAAI